MHFLCAFFSEAGHFKDPSLTREEGDSYADANGSLTPASLDLASVVL